MKVIKIGIAILIMSVMLSTASAANKYYLNPADSSVSAKDDTIDVELWLEAGEPVCAGEVSIDYTYCCADIISYTPNLDKFEDMSSFLVDGKMKMMFFHYVDGWALTNHTAGSYKLGTLTILCCNEESNCKTDLNFVECLLYESVNYAPTELVFTTEDGSFTCGTPELEPCLGDCFDASGGLIDTNVPCYDCLVEQGRTWKNYQCPDCASGCTCPSEVHTTCPQCCDGKDNDNPADGLVDWPNDPKCGCCIDEDETNGDVPCPPPCIPELPTFTLMSMGVLGMILLVRKRG